MNQISIYENIHRNSGRRLSPDMYALADSIRARSDVMFAEVRKGGLNILTSNGQSLRFVHYLENDSIKWVSYVE